MLLCIGPSDKIQAVTDAAIAVDAHVSGMDVDGSGNVSTYRKNNAITTATTTDLSDAPATGVTRNVKNINIRNTSANLNVNVTVQHFDGTLTITLYKTTLFAGQTLSYVEGVGWYIIEPAAAFPDNTSTASQTGFSTDTYLIGSALVIPATPQIGSFYRLIFDVTKTAAGTATPIVTIRIGTLATTGDTSRLVFTWGAGSAAVDTGLVECRAIFRSVGAGTAAVLQGHARATTNLTTTGWSTSVKALAPSGAGFDSTAIAGQFIGASYNGGTSASHTIQLVHGEWIP